MGSSNNLTQKAAKEWTLIASSDWASVSITGYSEIMIVMFDSSGNSNYANVFPVSAVPTSGDKWVGVFDPVNTAWVRLYNGGSFRMGNSTNFPGKLYAR